MTILTDEMRQQLNIRKLNADDVGAVMMMVATKEGDAIYQVITDERAIKCLHMLVSAMGSDGPLEVVQVATAVTKEQADELGNDGATIARTVMTTLETVH